MRLTLVIASLGRGGAERTASVLANAWAEQGKEITVITLAREDDPAYALGPAIHLRQLRVRGGTARNILHGLFRQWRTVRALRHAIGESQPDVIVSFMDIPNVLTILASRGLRTPVIITEHVHPEHYRIGRSWETLRRLVYRRADVLACVSKPLAEWFQQKIKVNACVIANPIDAPPGWAHERLRRSGSGHLIAGMGRLVEQKGFDLLLQAFSQVASRYPDWRLKVLGEGPLKDRLQAQALDLKLAGRVEFAGALADPFPVLSAADLFVFSSRFEGFGNALCEAMACGLPAISFDCPSGPAEIIRHGVDGLLVPAGDVSALAAAMDRLMGDEQERRRLAARAPEVLSRFSREKILALWQQLFDQVLAARTMRPPL